MPRSSSILGAPESADAYVGPGAGFALLSSFLVLFTTTVAAIVSLLFWPFRMLWRRLRGGTPPRASIRRLVIVGLDGQDPTLTDRFMAQGLLPNFKKLAKAGCYRRLKTTFPSVSPVAWSSFSTGTQPGRHNIFDFLDRDRRTYLPVLSSAYLGSVKRFFTLGRYRIPLEKPELRLLRKSKPFWVVLGEHRIWSTILRVPITFPPDRFYGAELSAMSVPDLLGTQGTFLLFTTRSGRRALQGGRHASRPSPSRATASRRRSRGRRIRLRPTARPLAGAAAHCARSVRAAGGGRLWRHACGTHAGTTERLGHAAVPGRAGSGGFGDYASPPDRDGRPLLDVHVAHQPRSREAGDAGVAPALLLDVPGQADRPVRDARASPRTPGRSMKASQTEGIFLQQAYDIDRERQDMFFSALDRLRTGALVCVFDATDRIQHMFWRYLDPSHPAHRADPSPHQNAIAELYRHNDALVGRVMQQLGAEDVLMVVSDHGFNSFRRGVNLNSWLQREGYLVLKPGSDGRAEWLRDVDWSATRAYSVGLTGMFLNLAGREAQGIVAPGAETAALKAEIIAKLTGLRDAREECGRDPRGLRHRHALRRPVRGERAGSADRLQRRLPRVVGRGHGNRGRARVRRQHQGVERRSLHRSAPGARRLLLQPVG